MVWGLCPNLYQDVNVHQHDVLRDDMPRHDVLRDGMLWHYVNVLRHDVLRHDVLRHDVL